MSRHKPVLRSSKTGVNSRTPGAMGRQMVGFRPDPLPKDVRRHLANNPLPSLPHRVRNSPKEPDHERVSSWVAPFVSQTSYAVVYTDVSYIERDSAIYVGLVSLKDGKVFRSAFKLTRVYGENPEDTAIAYAKRVIPGARSYFTDYNSSKHGTYAYRNHPWIKECHDLAGAKRRSDRGEKIPDSWELRERNRWKRLVQQGLCPFTTQDSVR